MDQNHNLHEFQKDLLKDILGNTIMLNALLNEELKCIQDMKIPKVNFEQIELAKLALEFSKLSLSNISNIDAIV